MHSDPSPPIEAAPPHVCTSAPVLLPPPPLPPFRAPLPHLAATMQARELVIDGHPEVGSCLVARHYYHGGIEVRCLRYKRYNAATRVLLSSSLTSSHSLAVCIAA